MAHYALLRYYKFDHTTARDDIRGTKIYGRNDEKLGTIDDVIFDHSTGEIRYVVVDAGSWFSSKKFLIPAHRLHSSTRDEEAYSVNLDKAQIEQLPRYEESDLNAQNRWENYERRYSDVWHAGPVQHREGSDRNLTPTPGNACRTRIHRQPDLGRGKVARKLQNHTTARQRHDHSTQRRRIRRSLDQL